MKSRLFIILFVLSFVGGFSCVKIGQVLQAQSNDAIGMRVVQNTRHESAYEWYRQNINNPGAPQSFTVDGYGAIRDGRTAYVNAANVFNINSDNPDFFTNIHIISYNQDSQVETNDVFAQILDHFTFNRNMSEYSGNCSISSMNCREAADCPQSSPDVCQGGKCSYSGRSCQKNEDCAKYNCVRGKCALPPVTCYEDIDCPNGLFCSSLKSRTVRDTRRLEDIRSIQSMLAEYKMANNIFPELGAGTYLKNKTVSVWPSWKETLEKDLSVTLPVDPVNILGPCAARFDQKTCWDEEGKEFASQNQTPLQLPEYSMAYIYEWDVSARRYSTCAVMESGFVSFADGDACTQSAALPGPDEPPEISRFCGDGICDSAAQEPETCATCLEDCDTDDRDEDGFNDCSDNCPTRSNADQSDFDDDEIGDVCDDCFLWNPDKTYEDLRSPDDCVKVRITQRDASGNLLVDDFIRPFFSAVSSSEFYCYDSNCDDPISTFGSSSNVAEGYGIAIDRRSNVFAYIYLDGSANPLLSIGILHDSPEDGSGGAVIFDFDNADGNNDWDRLASVSVSDDPDEFVKERLDDSGNHLPEGNWSWSECCTDGGMFDMARLNEAWSVQITPQLFNGIDRWHGRNPGVNVNTGFNIPHLDRSVTISYTPNGGQ